MAARGTAMTPAIRAADAAGIPYTVHRYRHREGAGSYGLEAAEALGLDPARVFKTLLASVEGVGLAVAIVPVDARLDLKALAAALGAKRAEMADPKAAERATGYVVGGISPLGQRRRLPTVLDRSALAQPTIYVSAGRRGLDIALAPAAVIEACAARCAAIARR